MGRINLTPLRVRKRALANLQGQRSQIRPSWLDVVGEIPPAQILTRQQPQLHPLVQVRTRSLANGKTQQQILSTTHRHAKSAKASRIFSPVPIRYEEDTLRKQFFSDHPWELARPRVILETTGDQHAHADWSTGLVQPGIPVSGESVVQRQLHLLHTVPDITVSQAYDTVRKEFYTLRRQEATRRRVAAEEAEATGAQFGLSANSWGMQIENKMHDDWERWARAQNFEQEARSAAFSGQSMPPAEKQVVEEAYTPSRAGRNSPRIGPSVGDAVFGAEALRQAKRPANVHTRP